MTFPLFLQALFAVAVLYQFQRLIIRVEAFTERLTIIETEHKMRKCISPALVALAFFCVMLSPLAADASFFGGVSRAQLKSDKSGLGADLVKNSVRQYATIADLRGAPAPAYARTIYLLERGGGYFVWDAGDNAANVAGDALQALFVAPDSDSTGASGVYARQHTVGVVDVVWYGASPAASAAVNDAAFSAAIQPATKVLFPAGVYNHTGIVLESKDDVEFFGQGPAVLNRTTAGAAVLTLGDAAHLASSRRFKMSGIELSASAAVSYGLQCLFTTDSIFQNLRVTNSTEIQTAVYIDYSWNNNFYDVLLNPQNGVEFGSNNANNNNFIGGRLSGVSDSLGVGVSVYGASNLFQGLDISTFAYGAKVGGHNNMFTSNYFEWATGGTAFVNLGALSGDGQHSFINNYFKNLGAVGGIGIEWAGASNPLGVAIYNNRFSRLAVGVSLGAGAYGWDVRANHFDTCTVEIAGVGTMINTAYQSSISQGGKDFQGSVLKYKVNAGAVTGTVIIDAIATMTKGAASVVSVRGIGRGSLSVSKSFSAVVVLNEDGSVLGFTLLSDIGSTVTGFQSSAGNLEVLTLSYSDWNFWIDSAIYYD